METFSIYGVAAFLSALLGPIFYPQTGAIYGGSVSGVMIGVQFMGVVAVLGWAHHRLNRPLPWLRWANESVYPWYMLHQTLIIALAVALAPLALGPVTEPAVLVAGTVLGCWLITDGLVRRFNPLRALFGLKPRARPQCLSPGSPGRPGAHSA